MVQAGMCIIFCQITLRLLVQSYGVSLELWHCPPQFNSYSGSFSFVLFCAEIAIPL